MGMKVFLVKTDCGFANYCRETGTLAHGFGIFGLQAAAKRRKYALIFSGTMALLPILTYPDRRLHTVAKPVADVDARIAQLVRDMLETMYDASGIGLAASQVDVHERVIVIDVSQERNQPLVLVNPKLVWTSPETHLNEEGCLSVPGIYDGVTRHNAVHVHALDDKGQGRVIEAQELLAVCIQHEMDHLMGKVFVEYLSPLKRNRIKTKMLKAQREDAR
jgi:peptide deformylase